VGVSVDLPVSRGRLRQTDVRHSGSARQGRRNRGLLKAEQALFCGTVCVYAPARRGDGLFARANTLASRRTPPVGFAHCEPGWDVMGASVTLRWRVLDVDCELRIAGTAGQVSVRRDGQMIGNATVESAAAAHQWASEQVDNLRQESERAGRTGTD
jgi:hypothetical protein